MNFTKINKPQWLIENEEEMLSDEQEAKLLAQSVCAYFGSNGKDFPCLCISMGFSLSETPGLGHTLKTSISLKESEDSWWDKSHLPEYLAEDFLTLYQEVLAKKPTRA